MDERIAGLGARSARVSLPVHPDPLPVVDPRRDVDVARPILHEAAFAGARLARRLDDRACPLAARTRRGAHELAEHALRHLLDATGAKWRFRPAVPAADHAAEGKPHH